MHRKFLFAFLLILAPAAVAQDDVLPIADEQIVEPIDVPLAADGPKAKITTLDGTPIPSVVKPNAVLYFASTEAVSSGAKGSILWIVTPESIEQRTKRLEFNGASVLVVEVGPDQYVLTVHQIAIKGDVGDRATVTIPVRSDGPPPEPGPKPPTPTPAKTLGDIIKAEVAAVAKTAATKADFESIAAAYETVAVMIDQGNIKDVATTQTATDGLVKFAARGSAEQWSTVKATIDRQLTSLKTTGVLVSVGDYSGVWKQIAAGIKAGLGPQPPPEPDVDPDPQPDTDPPIPTAGLHVMIIYESDDRISGVMPASQVGILTSEPFQRKMDEFSAKWRVYDQHTDMKEEDKEWVDAMARPRSSLPWIIISNGKTGYEGKLPLTADETIKLVEKYRP